jgi:hypothetical protein
MAMNFFLADDVVGTCKEGTRTTVSRKALMKRIGEEEKTSMNRFDWPRPAKLTPSTHFNLTLRGQTSAGNAWQSLGSELYFARSSANIRL